MASSKDIYESSIYAANIYAAGVFRGVGQDLAFTLIAPWSRPIACYGNYDRIATCGGMQPVVAAGTSERIEVEG